MCTYVQVHQNQSEFWKRTVTVFRKDAHSEPPPRVSVAICTHPRPPAPQEIYALSLNAVSPHPLSDSTMDGVIEKLRTIVVPHDTIRRLPVLGWLTSGASVVSTATGLWYVEPVDVDNPDRGARATSCATCVTMPWADVVVHGAVPPAAHVDEHTRLAELAAALFDSDTGTADTPTRTMRITWGLRAWNLARVLNDTRKTYLPLQAPGTTTPAPERGPCLEKQAVLCAAKNAQKTSAFRRRHRQRSRRLGTPAGDSDRDGDGDGDGDEAKAPQLHLPDLFATAYSVGKKPWGANGKCAAFIVVYRGSPTLPKSELDLGHAQATTNQVPRQSVYLQLRTEGKESAKGKGKGKGKATPCGLPGGVWSAADGTNVFRTALRELQEEGFQISAAQFASSIRWTACVPEYKRGNPLPKPAPISMSKAGVVELTANPASIPGCEPSALVNLPTNLPHSIVVIGIQLERLGRHVIPEGRAGLGWTTSAVPPVLTPDTVRRADTAGEVDTSTIPLGGVWVPNLKLSKLLYTGKPLVVTARAPPRKGEKKGEKVKAALTPAFSAALLSAAWQLGPLVCAPRMDGLQHTVHAWHATTKEKWAAIQSAGNVLMASRLGMQGPAVYVTTREGAQRFLSGGGVLLKVAVQWHSAVLQRRLPCPCGTCGSIGVDHTASAAAYSDACIVVPSVSGHAGGHGIEVAVFQPSNVTIVEAVAVDPLTTH